MARVAAARLGVVVDSVLGKVGLAHAGAHRVAQLPERAVRAQRAVVGQGHLVEQRVFDAVDDAGGGRGLSRARRLCFKGVLLENTAIVHLERPRRSIGKGSVCLKKP